MTDKNKKGGDAVPIFGDIAAELARARANAGLSHTDLHRTTGISRSVLLGYENGRTKPGAKEIRLLCDALKVSPNRLIYGSDEPQFKDEFSLFFENVGSDDRGAALMLGTLILMLTKEERLALLTLARSILVGRHGKQVLDMASSTLLSVGDVSNAMDSDTEWSIEELEEFKLTIEEAIAEAKKKAIK